MGYVPLFDHLTTGTLYGKWPDIGLWPVLLSMADKHGRIDVVPQVIAGATGLSVEEVVACIGRFCAPDPGSRTMENEGRRLELIDPARAWGWRVLNHAAYREKARLLAKDTERTNSGVDAERKRIKRNCPPCPPLSPEIPLSDADADTDAEVRTLRSSSSGDLSPSSSGRRNGSDVLQKRETRRRSVAALAREAVKTIPNDSRGR